MEKITSSWWPCSLPPPLSYFTSTVLAAKYAFCLSKIKSNLKKTFLLILFSPYHSKPSPSSLPHCWWICNLLYQENKRRQLLIYSKTVPEPAQEHVPSMFWHLKGVESTPDQCQDSWITFHLPQKTQDSFVQTSPRPRKAWLAPNPPPKNLKYLPFIFWSFTLQ